MTISEAITTILHSLDIDEQNFSQVLRGNHPDMVAMRAALVQLADAVRGSGEIDYCSLLQSCRQYCHNQIRILNMANKQARTWNESESLASRRGAFEDMLAVMEQAMEDQKRMYEQKCLEYMERSKESDFID